MTIKTYESPQLAVLRLETESVIAQSETTVNSIGDWYEDTDDWNDASDDVFAANTAMLGCFGAKDVVLNFPGAL